VRKLMLMESGVGADQRSAKGLIAPRVNDVYAMELGIHVHNDMR